MGNLKLGNRPKRWGKPSDKFLEKKSLEEASQRKTVFEEKWVRAQALQLPEVVSDSVVTMGYDTATAEVGIYLDDERPCPSGWTLARTSNEFFTLLERDDEFLNQVTHLSLDWYLGERDTNGVEVAKRLAYMFLEGYYGEKRFLPNLKSIGCHSSDRDQAARMARELDAALNEDKDRGRVRIRLATPPFPH